MPRREALEIAQKIDEIVERLERVRELLKLRLMETQIKIARLKAEARAKGGNLEG
jgi:hypothetical protein